MPLAIASRSAGVLVRSMAAVSSVRISSVNRRRKGLIAPSPDSFAFVSSRLIPLPRRACGQCRCSSPRLQFCRSGHCLARRFRALRTAPVGMSDRSVPDESFRTWRVPMARKPTTCVAILPSHPGDDRARRILQRPASARLARTRIIVRRSTPRTVPCAWRVIPDGRCVAGRPTAPPARAPGPRVRTPLRPRWQRPPSGDWR